MKNISLNSGRSSLDLLYVNLNITIFFWSSFPSSLVYILECFWLCLH